MPHEDLKGQLRAKAEAIIGAALNEGRLRQDISAMEQAAVTDGQAMRQALIEGLSHVPPLEASVLCPQCGEKGHRKGKQRKWVVTLAGEIQVERECCYCERCKAGFFPQRRVEKESKKLLMGKIGSNQTAHSTKQEQSQCATKMLAIQVM